MRNDFYVYCLFRPDTFRPCYIGKGRGKRVKSHDKMGVNHDNRILASLYRRLGPSLPCVILHENLTEAQSFEYEIALIKAIGRMAHGGTLANMTDGGEGSSGRPMSDKARAAISKAQAGRKPTDEEREKMRLRMIGNTFSKGNKMSEERIKAFTEVAKRPRTEEWKRKISEAQKGVSKGAGRTLSAEHRRKIGEASARRKVTDETRQKISLSRRAKYASGELVPSNLGKKMSDEQRKKLSEAHKERYRDGTLVPYNRGKPMDDEQKVKISKTRKARFREGKIALSGVCKKPDESPDQLTLEFPVLRARVIG